MPSSELQSRMTSLPISCDPWIWQCGAEGGTVTGRVSNRRYIYHEPEDDSRDINIQHTGTSDSTAGEHISEDHLMSKASEHCTIHRTWSRVQGRQLRLAGSKYVKKATESDYIFKIPYGFSFTVFFLQRSVLKWFLKSFCQRIAFKRITEFTQVHSGIIHNR